MKGFFKLFFLVFLACKPSPNPEAPAEEKLVSFEWMLGSWQRSNENPGKDTYEHWQKANDTLYLGLGFTMQGNDTIWRENVKLLKRDTSWIFSVTGKGDIISTDFILTDIVDQSFVCENPNNEFPKMILYKLKGDSLFAKISGGGADIEFKFGKDTRPKITAQ